MNDEDHDHLQGSDESSPGPGSGSDPETETDAAASDWSSPGYDRSIIDSVWQFAETVSGNDESLWRKDEYGAWINRLAYGQRHSQFGWEICALSGSSHHCMGISPLRPMQWQNYLDQVAAMTHSRITADGRENVRKLL